MALNHKVDPRRVKRSQRHDARRVLWRLSNLDRVRDCGYVGVQPGGSVVIKATGSGADRRAGFSGVSTCGSTWACPVCAHKIASERAGEVAQALANARGKGLRAVMVTLTMRHDRGQRLRDLWDGLSYAWGKVTSGRGWLADQHIFGIEGWVRVVEVTYGCNGWHVHVHVLVFVRSDDVVGQDESDALACAMFARWQRALVRKGFRAPLAIRNQHGRLGGGVEVHPVTGDSAAEALGDYFAKAGYELTNGQGKDGRRCGSPDCEGHRSPFQILRDLIDGGCSDEGDVALWHEYERASHGRRQMTWAHGFRAELLTAPERSDEEVAQDDVLDGQVVAVLPAATWRAVRDWSSLLLDLAEDDDTGDVLAGFLADNGFAFARQLLPDVGGCVPKLT